MTTHAQIRQRHFEHLNSYRNSQEYAAYAWDIGLSVLDGELPSLLGQRWEIDAETYHEFLEVLPPLAHRGNSFYLSEFTFGDITTRYTKEGDKYFCEFARWPERTATQRPTESPWGFPDSTREIAPGIVFYSTPSHGGFWLSPDRVAEMPKPLREFVPFGGPQSGPGRWFEEDADWSVVAAAFPQYFAGDDIRMALSTLRAYKPELFAEVVSLIESQGKQVWSIHYMDMEFARTQDDPTLGIVLAASKDEAEQIAATDKYINRRAMPCASLWAARVKSEGEGRGR